MELSSVLLHRLLLSLFLPLPTMLIGFDRINCSSIQFFLSFRRRSFLLLLCPLRAMMFGNTLPAYFQANFGLVLCSLRKTCDKILSRLAANCYTSTSKNGKWQLDFVVFHNITSDLANLSIYSEYDGQYEVVLGNGTSLQIAHIGSTSLPSTSCSIFLKETFHVPLVKKKILFLSISLLMIMMLLLSFTLIFSL